MSTFKKFPQFIETDIRTRRSIVPTSVELMKYRHAILLPESLIAGKSILDIGCCVGATGAWALDNGAASYTGVEKQEKFVNIARQNFNECFSDKNWQIIHSDFRDFFDKCDTKYDIIYAGGVIYSDSFYQSFLDSLVRIANDVIVVESINPRVLSNLPHNENSLMYPITEYYSDGSIVHEDGGNMRIKSSVPSIGAVSFILQQKGFVFDVNTFKVLRQTIPDYTRFRWGAVFKKSDNIVSDENIFVPWKNPSDNWKFDNSIAPIFVEHARKHIPDYDRVIDLSIDVCLDKFQTQDIKIIDVGCATGETINRFYNKGFSMLFGVDNSPTMLEQCDKDKATYILSETFPKTYGKFNVVLCNWTLHFIEDKLQYLNDVFASMENDGVLIITDKTKNDGLDLSLYHRFKMSVGVSRGEVQNKAQSVKQIMHINDCIWYINKLNDLGFKSVSIINATPCFTTFVAIK